MVAANRIAVRRGLLDPAVARCVESLLERLSLPRTGPAWTRSACCTSCAHDKKACAGTIRFILRGLGDVDVYEDVGDDQIADALSYLSQPST